ncbi:MAG: DUF2520 domain-containing protein [Candidatus Aminicenantes bacterium]|nr:MAG: DUF2520 domain-containing protein [Candidatus Aminicenantes bacterium]
MSDIAIIGAGKLGTNLGYALMRKGHRITVLSDKNLPSAQESQQIIGQGEVTDENSSAARHGQWIILAVPDDAIETVAEELADSALEWQDRFVFHCSGLHTTDSLNSLEKRGALVASLHPVQSFPQKKPDPKAFEDIFFGLEGKQEALNLAIGITRQLGGRFFILEASNKPLYHTACSMASNFLATLLDTAAELLSLAGLADSTSSQVLMPLVQGTLQNVNKFDAGKALTGPVVRGDEKSIAKHLEALRELPELYDLYTTVAYRSLQIAKREKYLSEEKIKALKALLGDK